MATTLSRTAALGALSVSGQLPRVSRKEIEGVPSTQRRSTIRCVLSRPQPKCEKRYADKYSLTAFQSSAHVSLRDGMCMKSRFLHCFSALLILYFLAASWSLSFFFGREPPPSAVMHLMHFY
jgi:hypothetical protein